MVAVLRLQSSVCTTEVQKYGLWAIKNLAARNAANRTELGEQGACLGECLLGVGRHIGCIGGHEPNRARLGEQGACLGDCLPCCTVVFYAVDSFSIARSMYIPE